MKIIVQTATDSFQEFINVKDYYVKEGCLHIVRQSKTTYIYDKDITIIPNHAYLSAWRDEE